MKIDFNNLKEKLLELWDCTLTLQSLRLTDWFGSSYLANRYFRPTTLRLFGFNIGQGCYIRPGITMQAKRKNLTIGAHSTMNMYCYIDAPSPIEIGKYCNIGPNVYFINGMHEIVSDYKNLRPILPTQPIIVEDFVWIAANVTILNSVRIGHGSVVAAGALVTKDVPPNCLMGGVPAKIIRHLDQADATQPTPHFPDLKLVPHSGKVTLEELRS
jgi:maltose O-acetyltransferase